MEGASASLVYNRLDSLLGYFVSATEIAPATTFDKIGSLLNLPIARCGELLRAHRLLGSRYRGLAKAGLQNLYWCCLQCLTMVD